MPHIVCVDGNIGAGKSSILDVLKTRGYTVLEERLSEWKWCLEKFYKDPDRWTFTLQMAILHSMAKLHDSVRDSNEIVFVERCPASGMIFVENSFNEGSISEEEVNLIRNFYSMFGWLAHKTIKLKTPALVCFERMKKRGRECERNVSFAYIQNLEQLYANLDGELLDPENKTAQQLADIVESIALRETNK